MTRSRIFIAIAALASLAGGMGAAQTASAADIARPWAHHHPRQAQVLHREHNQLVRIHRERAEGRITRGQAHAMAAETRAIGHEERADARAHGGRITRHEHRELNRELNAQSRTIGR
jgi:Ni/Co efflux regulator RcnB